MPSDREAQVNRLLASLETPISDDADWLLERAPDDLNARGRHDLSHMLRALDLATALATNAVTVSSGGVLHGRDTVMSYLMGTLRRELVATLAGVKSPLLQPRHGGKSYPWKNHPVVIRLKRNAVGVIAILSEAGHAVSEVEEAVLECLKDGKFTDWKVDALRRLKSELTKSGEIAAVKTELLSAAIQQGREITQLDEVQAVMRAWDNNDGMARALLGRLKVEAATVTDFRRLHLATLAPKT